jgi:acyl-CoA synthetase (NDP forming)
MANYADWRSRPPGKVPEFADTNVDAARSLCRRVLAERGEGWLAADEALTVLKSLGLPLVPGELARDADAAVAAAERLGYPVAVKLASRTVVHKTEVGGVHLNLSDADAVRRAFAMIQARLAEHGEAASMDGVLVQKMAPKGIEVVVGVTHDPLFGPVVAFGLGGVMVELLKDVTFRVTPLTDRDAAEMVRSIRGHKLLEGFRGAAPGDLPALEDLLLRIAKLAEEVPEVSELDLNPVFVLPPGHGCAIADARLMARPTPPSAG